MHFALVSLLASDCSTRLLHLWVELQMGLLSHPRRRHVRTKLLTSAEDHFGTKFDTPRWLWLSFPPSNDPSARAQDSSRDEGKREGKKSALAEQTKARGRRPPVPE
jgi:hypothetical protein